MAKLILDARLIFDDGDPAAEAARAYLVGLDCGVLTPATGRAQASRVQLHRCHHDTGDEPCEPPTVWQAD